MSSLHCELATSLRASLSSLINAHQCPICYSVFIAPVSLPCNHRFCSLCIRRHLHTISVCPFPTCNNVATISNLHPLREYDRALAPLRRATDCAVRETATGKLPPRIVFVAKRTGKFYEAQLQQFDLPVTGGVAILERRFRELALLWNANLDAAVPRSKRTVANAVMAAERKRKTANAPQTLSFFSKADASKVDENTQQGNDNRAKQGDDFATLIEKVKRKKEEANLHSKTQSPTRAKRPRTTVIPASPTPLPVTVPEPSTSPSRELQPPAAQPRPLPQQPLCTSPVRAPRSPSLPSALATPIVPRTTTPLRPFISPSPAGPISSVSDCASPVAPQASQPMQLSEELQQRIARNHAEAKQRKQRRRAERNLEEARRRRARFERHLHAQMRQPKF